MKKSEIENLPNNKLIVEYVRCSNELTSNYVLNRGVKRLQVICTNMENELVKRGILNDEDIKRLYM